MTEQTMLGPENTVFVVLSFEGPDPYAQAGGLGVRVRELTTALATDGFTVHHCFVGDPWRPGTEARVGGRLILHRWCQWISRYYPQGVYDGEEAKLYDFNESIPGFVLERVARPAVESGKNVVVMGEEWHTAHTCCLISDTLHYAGLRSRALLLWNANNTMGFHRINWSRLAFTSAITTVSRYMKHILWRWGVNPLVIPNGIPSRLLRKVPAEPIARLRRPLDGRPILFKMARFDPDKRWLMAIDAVARLKRAGHRPFFIMRGGIEAHGSEVLAAARGQGLLVANVREAATLEGTIDAILDARWADVVSLDFFVSEALSRVLYAASDAVLANSGHEPFGLVALEAMAAGGLVFTGCSGEDYARHFENAIVLETDDPTELVEYVLFLRTYPREAANLRDGARRIARLYTWENVIANLLSKLEYLGRAQGLLKLPAASRPLAVSPINGKRAHTPQKLVVTAP